MNEIQIKSALTNYFKFFSSKNIESLEAMFSKKIQLFDWEIESKGIVNVVETNRNIFKSVDSIEVSVKELFINQLNACCVIEILINKSEVLKVIDLISFNEKGKIIKISAYKQ